MNKSARGVVLTLILLVLGFALILPDTSNIGVIGIKELKALTCRVEFSDVYNLCSTFDFFSFAMQFIGIAIIVYTTFMMFNQTKV